MGLAQFDPEFDVNEEHAWFRNTGKSQKMCLKKEFNSEKPKFWMLEITFQFSEAHFILSHHHHLIAFRMRAKVSPKVGWKWKSPIGVGKSEMSIFWCISVTNPTTTHMHLCLPFSRQFKVSHTYDTLVYNWFAMLHCCWIKHHLITITRSNDSSVFRNVKKHVP